MVKVPSLARSSHCGHPPLQRHTACPGPPLGLLESTRGLDTNMISFSGALAVVQGCRCHRL